jgi:hypothetical protein
MEPAVAVMLPVAITDAVVAGFIVMLPFVAVIEVEVTTAPLMLMLASAVITVASVIVPLMLMLPFSAVRVVPFVNVPAIMISPCLEVNAPDVLNVVPDGTVRLPVATTGVVAGCAKVVPLKVTVPPASTPPEAVTIAPMVTFPPVEATLLPVSTVTGPLMVMLPAAVIPVPALVSETRVLPEKVRVPPQLIEGVEAVPVMVSAVLDSMVSG